MLVVDNKVIHTSIADIVELLRQQLALQHSHLVQQYEVKNKNIRICCPIHDNGNESHPSCDILLEDKMIGGELVPAGTVHCFACGYKASFIKFIKDCLQTSYRTAVEWLLSVSSYSLQETTRDISGLELNENKTKPVSITPVTLGELREYDYIHPYMFERKLTDEVIQKFEVGYDPKLDALTFPVYVNGECLFVAKRRVKYKRFDMPKINPKPIYGLDYINGKEIIVCESVINALTCWTYGKQAVALFGTGSDYQIEQLNNVEPRYIILALDPDEAGRNAMKRIAKRLTNKIVSYMKLPDGKDINDITKEEFMYSYENQELI